MTNARHGRTIAIIPARGGSERLAGKNVRVVGGKTLVRRAIDSAAGCDLVVVTTDDRFVVGEAATSGREVVIIERRALLASSTASLEPVIGDALLYVDARCADIAVVLQPTSPLRTREHVDSALELLHSRPDLASVVSVTRDPHIHFGGKVDEWERTFAPWYRTRPDTKHLGALAKQNGAIYAVRVDKFFAHNTRMPEPIGEYTMPEWCGIDVDTTTHLRMAEALLREFGE